MALRFVQNRIAIGALVAAIGLPIVSACNSAQHPTPTTPAVASASSAPVAVAPARLTPAEIAARALPAVCSVRTEGALGTGFVVDRAGVIATNLHVVAGETRILVTLADKRALPVVEIVGYSPRHDLVLLRIESGEMPALTLGDSDALRPGDAIVAIGNPLGLEDTVSNGLISAVRQVEEKLVVLQISAPIAPGSSGGPIFDERGDVVGVATAIVRGGENLAFGMPSQYLKDLLHTPTPISLEVFADRFPKRPARSLPQPKRSIPHFPIASLAGCSDAAQKLTIQSIGSAIEVGAPLYNQGNFPACYHVYEGAAQDLERKLPRTCKGPIKALATGRANAAALTEPSDQAWAMRDAFDGVLDVIMRKANGVAD